MWKFLSTALFTFSLVVGQTQAIAVTCASRCGPKPIQFELGEKINFQVVNRTSNIIFAEKMQGSDAIAISPGQKIVFTWTNNAANYVAVSFWDANGLALKANISRLESQTLQIEIRPAIRPPGDHSVELKEDGLVGVS